ncbi:class I SAM-dependent methyltransferase [Candidatus Hydrogenedentota bacterium]
MCRELLRKAFDDDPDAIKMFWEQGPDEHLVELVESGLWPSDAHALDIGCGGGRNTGYLAECGFAVSAVDISFDRATLTRYRMYQLDAGCPKLALTTCGSMFSLPYKESSFELVVSVGTYYSASTDSALIDVLQETARVMKNGGVLLAKLTSTRNPEPGASPVEGTTSTYLTEDGTICRPTSEELVEMFGQCHLFLTEPLEIRHGSSDGKRVTVVGLFVKECSPNDCIEW